MPDLPLPSFDLGLTEQLRFMLELSAAVAAAPRRRDRRPAPRTLPRLTIAVRALGRPEIDRLREIGAGRLADPEAEAAFELARHALQRMGVSGPELGAILVGLRRDVYGR